MYFCDHQHTNFCTTCNKPLCKDCSERCMEQGHLIAVPEKIELLTIMNNYQYVCDHIVGKFLEQRDILGNLFGIDNPEDMKTAKKVVNYERFLNGLTKFCDDYTKFTETYMEYDHFIQEDKFTCNTAPKDNSSLTEQRPSSPIIEDREVKKIESTSFQPYYLDLTKKRKRDPHVESIKTTNGKSDVKATIEKLLEYIPISFFINAIDYTKNRGLDKYLEKTNVYTQQELELFYEKLNINSATRIALKNGYDIRTKVKELIISKADDIEKYNMVQLTEMLKKLSLKSLIMIHDYFTDKRKKRTTKQEIIGFLISLK